MRASLAVVLPLLLVVARPARAEETFKLSWSAPAGCPSTDDVRSATLRNVDATAAKNDDDVLEADAKVEKNSDGAAWRVRLKTRRGATTGEREIEATTCRGVADATAVILALALVPPGSAPDEPKSQVINVETQQPPPSQPEQPIAPKPKATSSSGGPPLLALGAGVATDASTLPSAALGGSITLGFTPGRFRFEADGQRFAAQSKAASGSNAGAELVMTTIGGRACYAALRSDRFDLAPCAGAHVLFIDAGGFGSDSNFEKSEAWTTLNAGALGRAKLSSWFALRVKVDAFTPLSRPTFVVQNGTGVDDIVHRPPTLGVSAAFGAEVNFL